MTHEEYEKAARYWKDKDKHNVEMQDEDLSEAMEAYIVANNTCALATGTGDFVRCTPIEYTYFDKAFWMFTEGGEKFIGLEKNKNVCIAIYDAYSGFGKLKGMQVTGVAEIIETFSEVYVTIAEKKKIPLEALKRLPEPMHLIKVVPKKIEFLNSDFKKDGFSTRQQK